MAWLYEPCMVSCHTPLSKASQLTWCCVNCAWIQMLPDLSGTLCLPCKITFFVTRDPGSAVATKSPGLVAPPSLLSLSMNRSVFTSIPWWSVSTCKPSRTDLGLQPDYACDSIRTPDGNNWSWGQIYLGPWFQRGQWSKFIVVAERKPLDGFLLRPLLFSLDPHEAIHI